MKTYSLRPGLALICVMLCTQAQGYGGGSGGASCAEAEFYRESPVRNSTVSAFDRFAIIASENTDMNTLDLQINGVKAQPNITPQRTGESLIELKMDPPLNTPGKIRITLRAKSKEGCETFLPIYLEVKS